YVSLEEQTRMKVRQSSVQHVDQREGQSKEQTPARFTLILLIIGIVLLGVNLRLSITSVGPLISAIQADTGFSGALIGLLSALPLFAFGAFSALAPFFARRWGIELSLLVSLILLAAGILVRSLPWFAALFIGT